MSGRRQCEITRPEPLHPARASNQAADPAS